MMERRALSVLLRMQCGDEFGALHAADDLLMHLLREQLLAEGAEQIRGHDDVEPHLSQELALHFVELDIAEHREQLRERAVSHWLVLPHLVREQQGCQEKRPPSTCMQRDVGALLKPAQVDDAHNEGGHTEDALVQDAKDEGAHVRRGAVMHRIGKDPIQISLVVVLDLEEVLEHVVPLHALQHVRVRADVPVEKVYGGAEELRLQRRKALRRLSDPGAIAKTCRLAN
mmetsp:Transcript_32470/g.93338  ORF Transcript_32470/g.93338 Transcript_32470/m.93338 type:complete len:228 (-) Transcript_32470:111-794(-)